MSSTNKTSNYNLSQFLGTDKPAWLSDYNGDMSKIDAGINTAQTTATGADGKADTNATSIGTLSSLNTTAKTSCVAAINEANTLAGTANTAAGTALSTANTAASNANAALTGLQRFNFTSFNTLTPSTNKGTLSGAMNFATDSSSSIYKVYGRLSVNLSGQSGDVVVTLGTTSLRPDTAYTIEAAAFVFRTTSGGSVSHFDRSITIGTNGVITMQSFQVAGASDAVIWLPPCLYFNADFGDTPTPE